MTGQELAEEALQQYAIEYEKCELIRHNENMTYNIDDRYLLRIHRSKEGFTTSVMHEEIDACRLHNAEAEFLLHLKKNGLYVQTPVKNRKNEFITILKDKTPATVLTWIPGRTLEKEDLNETTGYQLGVMLRSMHKAAQGFSSCDTYRYDKAVCDRLSKMFEDAPRNETIESRYYEIIVQTIACIRTKLKEAEPDFLCLHSDLSLSNVLLTGQGLVPIDFSLFGVSSPLLDFGSFYCFTQEEKIRDSMIKGYEEKGEVSLNKDEIKLYFAFQILLGIGLHYELWYKEEWFCKRLPKWCQETFEPVLERWKDKV